MPWIMEIVVECPKCKGFGAVWDSSKHDGSAADEEQCPMCRGGKRVWLPVNSASELRVYSYETKEHAKQILLMCYRSSVAEEVRVREVVNVPEPKTPGPGPLPPKSW